MPQIMAYPFAGYGVRGVFEPKAEQFSYETSIRNILMTPKGSIPYDPDFGSALRQFVFDLNDEISQQLIKYYAFRDVQAQEPRLRVVGLDATFDVDNYTISFTVAFIAFSDPAQVPQMAKINNVPMIRAA